MKGAVIGLLSGMAMMVGVMLLWNYYITPIYMGYPREAVKELLLPAFLPFNLIKGSINVVITFLLYRPIVVALHRANLVEDSLEFVERSTGKRVGIVLVGGLILVSCVFGILILQGAI